LSLNSGEKPYSKDLLGDLDVGSAPILIVLPNTMVARNYVATPMIDDLVELGERTGRQVVFCVAAEEAQEPIERAGAKHHGLFPEQKPLRDRISGRLSRIAHRVATYRFNEVNAFITQERYKKITAEYGNKSHPSLWQTDVWPSYLGFPFPRSKKLLSFTEKLMASGTFAGSQHAKQLIRALKPGLVIIADSQLPVAFSFAREARRQGAKVVGGVRTWDHLTKNGPVLKGCDEYWVWNPTMYQEITEYHDISPDEVQRVGSPQFDWYFQHDGTNAGSVVAERFDIAENSRVILFGANRYFRGWGEPSIAERLAVDIDSGKYGSEPTALIIRSHPYDKKFRERFEPLTKFNCVRLYESPNVGILAPEILIDDARLLANVLAKSALLICGQSTVAIDASCMDVPVINLAFEGDAEVPELLDARTRYDVDHYQKLLATGGTTLVENFEEFDAEVSNYLDDSSTRSEGRLNIRENFAGMSDSKSSSERIIDRVEALLNS
jgi:CDP-glycerol glycerophosphotransferase (TagB/SpsB family)